jgi:hypothetical protein
MNAPSACATWSVCPEQLADQNLCGALQHAQPQRLLRAQILQVKAHVSAILQAMGLTLRYVTHAFLHT